jgi:hypothetical protein
MLNLPTVKDNLVKYIDAGFPILYIYTYEEAKADKYIESIAGGYKLLEWNGANGFVDFRTKASLVPNKTLESTLELLKNGKELHRKLLVIKDASDMLRTDQHNSNRIIALLKEIARKIRTDDGIDSTVIIISSTLHIPQDLEKMITVLDLDFPDEKEIDEIISKFMEINNTPTVHEVLLEEMSLAFKGLSEFEIEDLLSLAVSSEDGELTRKALQLIFDQKQQMIMKAGVLEMIPLKALMI